MISETEFFKTLKKYDFSAFLGDGSIVFSLYEPQHYFCKIGSFSYNRNKNWCLKIRIYDTIKFKHDRIVGCSDKATLCNDLEELEKCLQNISAQRKKLLVYLKIRNINKDFKKGE